MELKKMYERRFLGREHQAAQHIIEELAARVEREQQIDHCDSCDLVDSDECYFCGRDPELI